MSKIHTVIETIIFNDGGVPSDWKDVLKMLAENSEECKNFVDEMKNVIKFVHPNQQLIALELLDYVVDESIWQLHSAVASKDFISFLVAMLKGKDNKNVQYKILKLIQKWGIKFESQRDKYPNFLEVYQSLTDNDVEFPDDFESTYHTYLVDRPKSPPIISKKKEAPKNELNLEQEISKLNINDKSDKSQSQKGLVSLENNYGDVRLDLNPENYPKKYKKFVSELITLLNYINLSNEMIDNSNPNNSVDEILRETVSFVKQLEQNLQMAISNQVQHEGLLAICLGINDDIIKLFKRYDKLKSKKQPEAFVSSFKTEYASCNLNSAENMKKSSYNGILIDSGISIGSNLNVGTVVKNSGNENLIDFGNNHNSSNNARNDKNSKVKDINDIFDSFK